MPEKIEAEFATAGLAETRCLRQRAELICELLKASHRPSHRDLERAAGSGRAPLVLGAEQGAAAGASGQNKGVDRPRAARMDGLTCVLVGALALLFALRLYRQLQEPPPGERSR